MPIENPLPQQYGSSGEGIGGVLKQHPEDFLVDELPAYEPSGEGEHIYLGIEKTSVSHSELISRVRRHFGVSEPAIGFAGMKDKSAVTRQTISVHTARKEAEIDVNFGHDRIKVLWAARHRNKIRLGHLRGNRFVAKIRGVEPTAVITARKRLDDVLSHGYPNYYGSQRFGYRINTHRLGLLYAKRDYPAFLDELLGTGGSAFPDYQSERREHFDAGRFAEAAALWTPADRNELAVVNALRDGKPPDRAVRAVGPTARNFWISALQSAIFNRVLERRLEESLLATLIDGDLAWKHAGGSVFRVTAESLGDPEISRRLAALEISPSGPLWGRGMIRAEGRPAEVEAAAIDEAGVDLDDWPVGRKAGSQGMRRPLRAVAANAAVEGGVDEHGGYVQISFDLSAGCYATVLLREIIRGELKPAHREH